MFFFSGKRATIPNVLSKSCINFSIPAFADNNSIKFVKSHFMIECDNINILNFMLCRKVGVIEL